MATSKSTPDTTPVEDARDELQAALPKAAETLTDLLDAEDERVQIRAAEALLDRGGLTKAKAVSHSNAKQDVGGATKENPLDDLL